MLQTAWSTLADGLTNEDGRVSDLLAADRTLDPGRYRLVFNTGAYYRLHKQITFYPEVSAPHEIDFKYHQCGSLTPVHWG